MPANCVRGVTIRLFVLAWASAAPTPGASGQAATSREADEIVFREALVIEPVGVYGRAPIHTDAIEAQIVAGRWKPPHEGDAVLLPDGSTKTWQQITADAEGWFQHDALGGGYAYVALEADAERIMLLEASGHAVVYVNGEPRAGDPYHTECVVLPVRLVRGVNHFLFAARGKLGARLTTPRAAAMFDVRDATLPDAIIGETGPLWGGVVVMNASSEPLRDAAIRTTRGGAALIETPVPTIPPLSVRKVAVRLPAGNAPEDGSGMVELTLAQIVGDHLKPLDSGEITLLVRPPDEPHRRTFRSAIDGSIQYYAVNPARPTGTATHLPALFLTLHGAGVEASGQAASYASKTWGHIVAPTNRRPFGFDWEDWGRLDALEVLAEAQQRFGTDPRRTYLTGHSMGGHGVWQIGALFPDRFAAVGPSAGWISFASYTGAARPENDGLIADILRRAAAPSDTLFMAHNYGQHGVYILHGADDDNVPAEQARAMRTKLGELDCDLVYHEQPGAGHWWDASDEPGVDCVVWAPMFDFFARRIVPDADEVRYVNFVTVNPAISARSQWVTVETQVRALEPSSVELRYDPGLRRLVGTTTNVARLVLDLRHVQLGGPLTVDLDGQRIEAVDWSPERPQLALARGENGWAIASGLPLTCKGPHRGGPFKEAFRNRMVFVYGTAGTPEESAWAFAKARYDAETFWYRGNGSVDVIPDTEFAPAKYRDRNVILYGHAESNAAWPTLLADSPVQVRCGGVRVGERELPGPDLACLFLHPRPDSDVALVGAVSGTGIVGLRLTERLPFFLSGVHYPDCIVLDPSALSAGPAGIRAAGFFGNDWSVASGEFAWRE